ncbi:MAG TPA: discoidin domain-containing protein [Candidatus Eisenbacteria bacterium]|jgi:hypothetical protein
MHANLFYVAFLSLALVTSVQNSAAQACKGQNLALGKVATASAAELSKPSSHAVDGDPFTGWNSGDYAPQWIEIDLGSQVPVSCVRLLVDMTPGGYVEHTVTGRREDGTEIPLGTFRGTAAMREWLEIGSNQRSVPVRHVQITTTTSPSWVAWFEVEVTKPLVAMRVREASNMCRTASSVRRSAPCCPASRAVTQGPLAVMR